MNWEEHIVRRPEVCGGKPCVVGTRISVDLILEHLSNGWSDQDLLENFRLTVPQIRAAQAFAAAWLRLEDKAFAPA